MSRQVAIGYSLANILSPLLSILLLLPAPRPVLYAGLATFFECTTYFALAIQLAAIVTVSSKDFTSRVGDLDKYAASIVPALTIVPLIGPEIVLYTTRRQYADRRRHRLTFLLCVTVLSMYPCVRSILYLFSHRGYFFISNIPEEYGISKEEWWAVHGLCFGGATALSSAELLMLFLCQLIGIGLVFIFGVVAVLFRRPRDKPSSSSQEEGGGLPHGGEESLEGKRVLACDMRFAVSCISLLVQVGLAGPLLYGFWRLWLLQAALADVVGGNYELNKWGFGQVMAITVFVPVKVEMLITWWYGRGYGSRKASLRRWLRRWLEWGAAVIRVCADVRGRWH
jgi:hypothetical protein